MTHNGQPWRGLLVSVSVGLLLAVAVTPVQAQDPPASSGSYQPQAPSKPDFLLGRPNAALGVRGEWLFASAGSDIFDFVTEQLTLEKSSFNAPGFGMDLALSLTDRMDIVAGFDFAKSSNSSEYRDYIDNQNLPIQQTTSLRQSTIFGSLKMALVPRGRAISRYAWIPSAIVPYVGGGGGVINYDFKQDGDFVDFQDFSVFPESFRSHGWSPTVHVFGGADIQLYKRMFLSLEGRYQWANATLDNDFIDFEPMDLGGFRFGAGFHFMF
jgi:hypothetical protein